MDASNINTYSQAVIAGLAMRGISSDGLQLLMSTPKSRMARLLNGRANLSEREIDKIEALTGLTAGQLATSVIEPNGGDLTDLMNSWAPMLKVEQALLAKEAAGLKAPHSRGPKDKQPSTKARPARGGRARRSRTRVAA